MEKIGFDYVCVTSGGILPKTNLRYKPLSSLAKKMKKNNNFSKEGMIKDLSHANKIVKSGSADLVSFEENL